MIYESREELLTAGVALLRWHSSPCSCSSEDACVCTEKLCSCVPLGSAEPLIRGFSANIRSCYNHERSGERVRGGTGRRRAELP